jgi:RNA polymerase sigma-70 factor (ECF subfamily)
MVWGVCRRLSATHHDAEDAFQATFLVLARKAGCIVPRSIVANWLHGVALRTARKARAVASKRWGREMPVHKDREQVSNNPLRGRDTRGIAAEDAPHRSGAVQREG